MVSTNLSGNKLWRIQTSEYVVAFPSHSVDAHDVFLSRFRPLLNAEQSNEDKAIQERLRRPIEELIDEGYCLHNLGAFWLDATQFGLPVAVFSLGPGLTLGASHFE